jgi:2-keto-4-pentenoate hydratase
MPGPVTSNDDNLVARLYAARRYGDALALPQVELDLEEAHAVQLAVSERFTLAGDRIGGWKLGNTSGSARDRLGKGVRPFGFVLEGRMYESGCDIALAPIRAGLLEAEIALVVGGRLEGEVTAKQARDAVDYVAASFEIVEKRVAGSEPGDAAATVADGLSQWGLVLGDRIPTDDFSGPSTVELSYEGEAVGAVPVGVDVELDDVFDSLATLSAMLSRHGRGIGPGQVILTGACLLAHLTDVGAWQATFGGIGEVGVRFV